MRTSAVLLGLLCLLCRLPNSAAAAQLGKGPVDFVLLEKEALLVTPPRLIAAGIVQQAEWSPDGRYVLALAAELPYALQLDLQRPPAVKSRLVLWNAGSGEAKEIWSGGGPGTPPPGGKPPRRTCPAP